MHPEKNQITYKCINFCTLNIEEFFCFCKLFPDLDLCVSVYSNELEEDVAGDTSGHFKRLLIGLLQANRDESKEFDRNKAKQDAQAIYEAGEKKWGTDESRFNVLLVSRSYAQLRATFQEYAKLANKDIEDSLKSEMSGDLLQGMLAIG